MMLAGTGDPPFSAAPRRRFEPALFARAAYAEGGVFGEGRPAEIALLRAAGARDPSLGRVFEGHLNGVLLVAVFGDAGQRTNARRDVASGHTFAVWNTQGSDPVRIEPEGDGFVLHGGKTWCSGAGSVSRAIITAAWASGGVQMCLVPLDRERATVDSSSWKPLGMHASDSFAVDFEGVRLERAALIGAPGDYQRQPWFLGGALRFAAVHTGIVERLFAETLRYQIARERQNDAFAQQRIAALRLGVHSARQWLRAGVEAWEAFDEAPTPERSGAVVDIVDMVRVAVERIGLEAIELCVRSVGAHGLVEPLPFAGLVRDLQMYLRQPAPDAALVRVAMNAVAAARDNSAVASSTGCSS